MNRISEEASPAARFAERGDAQTEASRITNTPRSGVARVQFVGAWDSWVVEVSPRNKPDSIAVLREDGSVAKYH